MRVTVLKRGPAEMAKARPQTPWCGAFIDCPISPEDPLPKGGEQGPAPEPQPAPSQAATELN
jgi:hypothetical protein